METLNLVEDPDEVMMTRQSHDWDGKTPNLPSAVAGNVRREQSNMEILLKPRPIEVASPNVEKETLVRLMSTSRRDRHHSV